jgi:hypothetical protein
VHEPAGDVDVERVGEDGVAGGGVGGVGPHQVVPRLLGVEHGGPQLAPGLDAGPGEQAGVDLGLDVAELLQAQGVGQALGGVDGDDQHLAAQLGAGHGAQGRGGGGLAHPAGAAADHDLLGRQQLVERPGRVHQNPSSAPRAAAIWRVARTPSLRWNSSGT